MLKKHNWFHKIILREKMIILYAFEHMISISVMILWKPGVGHSSFYADYISDLASADAVPFDVHKCLCSAEVGRQVWFKGECLHQRIKATQGWPIIPG